MTEIIGNVSNKSVLKNTKRSWDEWIKILKNQGAESWPHKEIALFLKRKYKLTPWWQQMVTHGFEIAVGIKIHGQNSKGEYSVTSTKSLHHDQKTVWRFVCSPEGQKILLNLDFPMEIKAKSVYENNNGVFGEIRTLKNGERMRMRWQEVEWEKPSIVQILVVKKPKNKCLLVITHDHIKNIKMRDELRTHWKQALAELQARIKL